MSFVRQTVTLESKCVETREYSSARDQNCNPRVLVFKYLILFRFCCLELESFNLSLLFGANDEAPNDGNGADETAAASQPTAS